ncbi:hypothetical protein GCM10027418_31450 [Mariniluteicoccus endophyticus]
MLPFVLTHPQWDPVAFRLGPLQIHWYALMYLVGFALGYVLLVRRLRHQPYARITSPAPWTRANIEDMLLAAVAGVIIGGRLGYCLFYKPLYYAGHPLEIFAVWQGGMSFHGGAIGVAVALLVYAWRTRRPFLEVTDLLVPAVPTGLAAGRIGNFINGELWGRETPASLPWAMIFPQAGDLPRHPSQIYQFLMEGLLLFALLWWYARREHARGKISGAFVLGYGIFRFIAEYFREPDAHLGLIGGLSMGQWLCVPMILGGAGLWLWAHRAQRYADAVAVPAGDGGATAVGSGESADADAVTGKDALADKDVEAGQDAEKEPEASVAQKEPVKDAPAETGVATESSGGAAVHDPDADDPKADDAASSDADRPDDVPTTAEPEKEA